MVLEKTAVILELPKSSIQWGEPKDISIEEAIDVIQNQNMPGGLFVGMADGSVDRVESDMTKDAIQKLFNCSDGF